MTEQAVRQAFVTSFAEGKSGINIMKNYLADVVQSELPLGTVCSQAALKEPIVCTASNVSITYKITKVVSSLYAYYR